MLIRLEVVAVMVSVALLAPVALAVIVDEPDAMPLIVNVPVVAPCAIVTVGRRDGHEARVAAHEIHREPAGRGRLAERNRSGEAAPDADERARRRQRHRAQADVHVGRAVVESGARSP